MPTTTNYGWTTPADTDLVKDGASAIRTLGSSIDTTVFNNANAAIAKTIVDAKGDLIAATAADTPARLASSGVNGEVLTIDTSTATGLKWAAVNANSMTSLASGTLSGTTVVMSSISGSYKNLYLVVSNYKPVNDSQELRMRFNEDTTSNRHTGSLGFSVNASASFANISFELSGAQDNVTATGLTIVHIPDYANTTSWKVAYFWSFQNNTTTPTNVNFQPGWGVYNQTSAITAITLLTGSGDFSSGNYTLYGVK